MKSFLIGVLLILVGIFIAGVIALTTAPPRGQPVTLLPPPTPLPLVVDVQGAVHHPGLVYLPSGSRVQHALDAAGGPLPNANLTSLNLAAPLVDGVKLQIPTVSASSDQSTPVTSLVNINTATVDELAILPGIGPTTAQRIVDYREEFGFFAKIEDLTQVFGIGPATLAQIESLITITP